MATPKEIHLKLLTDISDEMIEDSSEYKNFIEHMKAYVPRGLLAGKKTLLDKLDAMATRGHLGIGTYDDLKKVAKLSGNIAVKEMIEETEQKLQALGKLTATKRPNPEAGTSQGHDSSTAKQIRTDQNTVAADDRDHKELRDYLIKKYKKNCSDVLVAPPKLDMWTDIREHYCEQDMKQVSMPGESQKKSEGEEETNIEVKSYRDIFYRKGKQCRNIYMKGDAGSGKSVFCQRMVNIWCDIHSADKSDDGLSKSGASLESVCKDSEDQKDKDILYHQFDFLFYITLRHATNLYDIKSMIKENLLDNCKELVDELKDVLNKESEKCLILMDGLDEWSPPIGSRESQYVTFGLPDRNVNLDWTILTTTRQWKLETIRPRPCEMDQLIELSGLSRHSVKRTIRTVVEYLNKRYSNDKSHEECLKHLYDKELSNIMTFPIMLKSLICIWFEDGHVGKSKCKIYAAIIDLYLRYADQKRNENTLTDYDTIIECHDLPACLQNYRSCQRVRQPLFKLSKLAFHTLFCKDRSASLVFESPTADTSMHGMSSTQVGLWLEIGLLSHDSVDTRCTKIEKMISFPHKTIQEFLAAMYMSMHKVPDTALLPTVKDICGSVRMVLEMSQVFVFLSGMAPTIVTTILQCISQVVSADEYIQRYRNTVMSQFGYSERSRFEDKVRLHVEGTHKLIVNCIRESVHNDQTNIQVHIKDMIIDDTVLKLCNIEEWFGFNKAEIVSFCVNLKYKMPLKTMSGDIWCQHLSNLERFELCLTYDDHYKDVHNVIASITRNSMHTLRAVSLNSVRYKQLTVTGNQLCVFQYLPCLQEFEVKYSSFNLHGIETIQTLHGIYMRSITCTHCQGPCRLDLSQLNQLQRLHLQNVNCNVLQINSSQLEECDIDDVNRSVGMLSTPISIRMDGDCRLLQILKLGRLSVNHDHLEYLKLLVKQCVGLREMTLHDITCCEYSTWPLDLSQHNQLRQLTLTQLHHISKLTLNTTQLRKCTIVKVRPASSVYEDIWLTFGGDCQRVENLTFNNIVCKHEEFETLMGLATQATKLRDITLEDIKCNDCSTICTCRLDMSQHTQLRKLTLETVCVSEVHINTTQLRTCTIDNSIPTSSKNNSPHLEKISLTFDGDCQMLQDLTLIHIVRKHEEIERLMVLVTKAIRLQYITLCEIKCSECGTNCTCRIDMSQHTQLEDLDLKKLNVSEVKINTTQLAECKVEILKPVNEISLVFHGDGRHLCILSLQNVALKHGQFEQLMLTINQATRKLYKLTLCEIKCCECCTIGGTCRLDLSQHTELRELELQCIHVSEVQLNITWLDECIICNLNLRPTDSKHNEPESESNSLISYGSESYDLTMIDKASDNAEAEKGITLWDANKNNQLYGLNLDKLESSKCTCNTWRLDMSKHTWLLKSELREINVNEEQFSAKQLGTGTIDNVRPISSGHTANGPGSEKVSLMISQTDVLPHFMAFKNIVLRHKHVEQLMQFVTQATQCPEITFNNVKCCNSYKRGTLFLDLSQHTELLWLYLLELHVNAVQINSTQLNHCTIDSLRPASSSSSESGSEEISLMFHGDGSKLNHLILTNIVLKHEQYNQLLLFATQSTQLQTIRLCEIKCNDLSTGCTCRLDLSQHMQLDQLKLEKLHAREVIINTTQLTWWTMDSLRPVNSSSSELGSEEISLMFHGDGRKLNILKLRNIVLKQKQYDQLMMLVTQATQLTDLNVYDTKYSDSAIDYTWCLDLSKQVHLKELELQTSHISELQINITQLRTCKIDRSTPASSVPNELGYGYSSLILHGVGDKLEYLILTSIILKHEQLQKLMRFVSDSYLLKEVNLNEIKCEDIRADCLHLFLYKHSQLRKLELQNVHAYKFALGIDTTKLEICKIDNFINISSAPDDIQLTLFYGYDKEQFRLALTNIVLNHDKLEQLMCFVERATRLEEITLNVIECSNCGTDCTCHIDLSQHNQLDTLWLHGMYVSQVQINTTQMRRCTIRNLKPTSSAPNALHSKQIPLIFNGDGKLLWFLTLTNIVLKHKQLEHLMGFVTQAIELREITLISIECGECGTGCTCRLDLSHHTQLRELTLQKLHVSEVQIKTTQLWICKIENLISASSAPNQPGSAVSSLVFHGDGEQLAFLTLTNCVMAHEQLEQFMSMVKQATGLLNITLNEIKCSDCYADCACWLELSRYTESRQMETDFV